MDEPYDDNSALWDDSDEGLFDQPTVQDGPGLFDEPTEADPATGAEPEAATTTEASTAASDLAPHPARERAARPTDEPVAPLALYRRYRPDTFDDVIGQEHVTEPLRRALANNKVNHAYLFSGPRGCGKTTSARILARSLNCEQGPTPTPCGQCQSCLDLARGGPGSIDVIELDAASNGGVEDARDLRERAFFAPVQSRYKIYIVDEAHMVTQAGFNALLKLVEEPPPHVKFIFATTEPDKVIGTIRSRTHHYPFRLVPPKVLAGYLATLCEAEGVAIDADVLPLVVRAGAGSVRDSLSVLDQLLGAASAEGVDYQMASALLGHTPDTLLDEIVDAFAAGDGAGVFNTVDKVIEVGQDPRRFAEDLLQRLRDLVIVAAVPEAVSIGLIDASGDQAERLAVQAAALGSGELTRAAEVIATGLTDMRGTTAPRLHLELMCSRVLLPGADVDDRGLHARLDRLERRLADGGVPVTRPEPAPSPREQWPDSGASHPTAGRSQQGAPEPADEAPAAAPPNEAAAAYSRPGDGAADVATGAGQQPATAPRQRPARPDGRTDSDGPRQRPHVPVGAAEPEPTPANNVVPIRTARAGDIDTTRMRNEWTRVLDEVKNRRRFTWILLSQNAQVHDVAEDALTLAFANVGARDSFGASGSSDILRDAIVEVLGADLRIVAVTDEQHSRGRSDHSGRSGGGAGAHDQEPDEPDPAPSAPAAESDSDHAEFSAAARAAVRPTSHQKPVADDAGDAEPEESPDDEDLDEGGEDAAALVRRELGGEVIDDQQR